MIFLLMAVALTLYVSSIQLFTVGSAMLGGVTLTGGILMSFWTRRWSKRKRKVDGTKHRKRDCGDFDCVDCDC